VINSLPLDQAGSQRHPLLFWQTMAVPVAVDDRCWARSVRRRNLQLDGPGQENVAEPGNRYCRTEG